MTLILCFFITAILVICLIQQFRINSLEDRLSRLEREAIRQDPEWEPPSYVPPAHVHYGIDELTSRRLRRP